MDLENRQGGSSKAIRSEIDGLWSAEDMGKMLLHLKELYNLKDYLKLKLEFEKLGSKSEKEKIRKRIDILVDNLLLDTEEFIDKGKIKLISDCNKSAKEGVGRHLQFVMYDNGIVYDLNTDLEWIAGSDEDTTWHEAKKWAENLSIDGGGWRMPTREELKSLYQEGIGIRNITPFLKTTGWWVWSCETGNLSSTWAFVFIFRDGIEDWFYCSFSLNLRGFAVRSCK